MSVNPYEPSRIPEPLVTAVPESPREIEFDLTLDDYVAFSLDHAKRSTLHKTSIGCFFVVAGMAVPVSIAAILLTVENARDFAMPLLAFGAIVLLSLGIVAGWNYYYGIPTFLTDLMLRHMLTRGDTSSIFGRYSISVSPAAIFERAPKSEHRFALSAVQKIILAPQHVYVYVSPVQAFIIPKRAFLEPRAPESFVTLLEQYSGTVAIRSK